MANFSIKNNSFLFIVFFSIIIIDQSSKSLIINNLELYETIQLFPFFNIIFIVNYGFAFGILNSPSLDQIIVSLVIFSIIIYFLFLLIKTQDYLFKLSLILIISGAIGNFIDRIMRGFVIDFLDIFVMNYHWPAFNFADSSITIGFLILIFNILILNKKL